MRKEGSNGSGGGLLINCLVLLAILALLAGLALPSMQIDVDRADLLQCLSHAKQIYTGVQSAALDYETTGTGIGWPADKGIKSGREYVRLLVKENIFIVSDLWVFTTSGQKPATSLDTISSENIGFRIANVSETDPPETIFLVTPNFLDHTPYPFVDSRHWWERLFHLKARRVGYIVLRKGGDGHFYNTPPSEIPAKVLGILPPREPKFLDP